MVKAMTTEGFVSLLRIEAEQKVKEYTELLHELCRLERRAERTRIYIEQLNNFVKAEKDRDSV